MATKQITIKRKRGIVEQILDPRTINLGNVGVALVKAAKAAAS